MTAQRGVKRAKKAKLAVWSTEIRTAIYNKKEAFYAWKCGGKPTDKTNGLVVNKKNTTKNLRKICRLEHSEVKRKERQEILDAKSSDMAFFHKLINKQRGKLKNCINELHVDDHIHKSPQAIIEGWHRPF